MAFTRGSRSLATRRPRSRRARSLAACSCDLLLDAVGAPNVAPYLAAYGVTPADVAAARDRLHQDLEREPADWRLRLGQRTPPDLDPALGALLAMARSPDSHAGRILAALDLPLARLRRDILARGRAASSAHSTPCSSEAPAPETSQAAAAARTAAPDQPPTAPTPAGDASDPDPCAPMAAPDVGAPEGTALQPVDPATLPPLHGRDDLLGRVADAMLRRHARPPLLVGPPGSGRTTLALHLARLVPRPLFVLDAAAYEEDGDLEADLSSIADEGGLVVLDNLDRVAGEVPPTFLGALARAWGLGSPPILTLVSPEQRARLHAWLPGLVHTFDELDLPPLEGAALREAVAATAPDLLSAHGITLDASCPLDTIVALAERYLAGPAMPGRALDLLDLACARAARLGHGRLTLATTLDVVAERSGLPRERLSGGDERALLDLERQLSRRVVGHAQAIGTIAALVRRNRAGFAGHRPVATVLLLGPSGVGKTELAKALADALYDRPGALVRLDMSEYAEAHAVARVVGAPPGYVGYEQGGALTDPLLAHPHCVVLLDEIEKAHRDVHQLLLQVFDDGRLTDGRGRTVDFRHAVVVMTSNLGSELLHGDPHVAPSRVLELARARFPVELWNRIEAPLVMRPLAPDELREVCKRLAAASSDRLFRTRRIRYSLTPRATDWLVARAGDDPGLGARPLRHLLARRVEALLAGAILAGDLPPGSQALVDHVGDALTLV